MIGNISYEISQNGDIYRIEINKSDGSRINVKDFPGLMDTVPNDIILKPNIIKLRKDKYSYAGIQLKLGNPSKRFIRKVLLEYTPDLIDIDCNYNKL